MQIHARRTECIAVQSAFTPYVMFYSGRSSPERTAPAWISHSPRPPSVCRIPIGE